MAIASKFFGRRYRLTLDPPQGEKKVFEVKEGMPAMDIKFNVEYARGQTAREGTVSILGLSMDTMHTYLDLAGITRGKAMSELVHVRLEAGYFTQEGMVEILDGFAWRASITSPPNMWLEIQVSEYNPLGARKVSFCTPTKMKLKAAVEYVLDQFSETEGMEFEVQDKTEEQLFDKSDKMIQPDFSGGVSLSEAVHKLNETVSDEIQFILKTSKEDDGVRTLLAIDKKFDKVTPGEITIDGDNGLLSVTGIDAVNGCITAFLDGGIEDELTHLNLKSWLNPQANGRYYIVKKQFVGHFMGQEWYARYICSARENDIQYNK